MAATQSVEMRSEYYMNQSETFFRQGASGEMSSIAVETQGVVPFGGRKNTILGEEYSLSPKPLRFGWNVSDHYSASEGWNYAKPRELYVEYKKPRWSLALGAKQVDKLQTDKTWANPIWFSRYREDKINTQTIGQVGLHGSADLGSGWSVSAVGIAAHIPDFGPHQSIEEGRFVSRNPWFRPPQSQVILNEGQAETPIHYRLHNYKTEEIVGKPGGILQVAKKIDSHQSVKVVGARKALPALHLSFPVVLELDSNSQNLDLEITPASVYHTAAAVEWSYLTNSEETENTKEIFTSFQYERPDDFARQNNWISQTFKEAYVASAGYKQVFGVGTFPVGLEISYWQVWGGDASDRGDLAQTLSVFERRYDFVQAVKLGASTRKGKLASSTAFTYDYAQQGVLWSSRMNYSFNREWSMGALLDLMGLVGPTGRVPDGLLSLYRANDRFGLGVSYVF